MIRIYLVDSSSIPSSIFLSFFLSSSILLLSSSVLFALVFSLHSSDLNTGRSYFDESDCYEASSWAVDANHDIDQISSTLMNKERERQWVI